MRSSQRTENAASGQPPIAPDLKHEGRDVSTPHSYAERDACVPMLPPDRGRRARSPPAGSRSSATPSPSGRGRRPSESSRPTGTRLTSCSGGPRPFAQHHALLRIAAESQPTQRSGTANAGASLQFPRGNPAPPTGRIPPCLTHAKENQTLAPPNRPHGTEQTNSTWTSETGPTCPSGPNEADDDAEEEAGADRSDRDLDPNPALPPRRIQTSWTGSWTP